MREDTQLSLREAADALGISEVSARRWVKSGKLKAAQPGRKYLIPREAVEELLRPKEGAPPGGEARRETVYRFTGEQKVTAEKLREHGIEANDSEVHVLNQYIELHERPPAGAVAMWYVEKEGEPVDDERVKTLLAFVLWKGILSPEQAEAAGKALHAELAGTSA